MNKLLLWIAICLFLSACTNWPSEGYFNDTTRYTEERIQFKQHYEYLNLHFSVANLRGAERCSPAHVKVVKNINSRVKKAIAVEDPQAINVELSILEKNITDLVINLNRVSANTNCAQPPRLLTSNFVHPLTYQLDLLLYCAPQFEEGNAILTDIYEVCLRQVGFLLLDNPDVVVEYTKYKLFKNPMTEKVAESAISFNQDIVVHNLDAVVDIKDQQLDFSDSDEDYNEAMRKYLLFDQVPSVNVQQLSRLQLNLEQQHTPAQIQQVQVSNAANVKSKVFPEAASALSLVDVELLNLRTDVILNYVTNLTADELKSNVIYEELSLDAIPPTDPVITTLMWQSMSNKDVDHKVKNWRFLLSEYELFSDAALPQGLTL